MVPGGPATAAGPAAGITVLGSSSVVRRTIRIVRAELAHHLVAHEINLAELRPRFVKRNPHRHFLAESTASAMAMGLSTMRVIQAEFAVQGDAEIFGENDETNILENFVPARRPEINVPVEVGKPGFVRDLHVA